MRTAPGVMCCPRCASPYPSSDGRYTSHSSPCHSASHQHLTLAPMPPDGTRTARRRQEALAKAGWLA
eukprot:3101606-Rhodomonas_salina.3